MKILSVLFVALSVSACAGYQPPGGGLAGGVGTVINTPAPAPTKASADSKINTGLAKIDAGIEYTATKVKAACSGARLVLTGVSFYAVNKPRWQQPIAVANASINSVCDGPTPTDIPGALRTIAEAVGAAIAASQSARSEPSV